MHIKQDQQKGISLKKNPKQTNKQNKIKNKTKTEDNNNYNQKKKSL